MPCHWPIGGSPRFCSPHGYQLRSSTGASQHRALRLPQLTVNVTPTLQGTTRGRTEAPTHPPAAGSDWEMLYETYPAGNDVAFSVWVFVARPDKEPLPQLRVSTFDAAGPKMLLCSWTVTLALPTALVHDKLTVTGLPFASAMLPVVAIEAVAMDTTATPAVRTFRSRDKILSLTLQPAVATCLAEMTIRRFAFSVNQNVAALVSSPHSRSHTRIDEDGEIVEIYISESNLILPVQHR